MEEDAVLAELPAPIYRLPREKPVPEEKAETKWEKFAKTKGITKTKRSRMVCVCACVILCTGGRTVDALCSSALNMMQWIASPAILIFRFFAVLLLPGALASRRALSS